MIQAAQARLSDGCELLCSLIRPSYFAPSAPSRSIWSCLNGCRLGGVALVRLDEHRRDGGGLGGDGGEEAVGAFEAAVLQLQALGLEDAGQLLDDPALLHRGRDLLVRQRTQLANAMCGLLYAFGLAGAKGDAGMAGLTLGRFIGHRSAISRGRSRQCKEQKTARQMVRS